MRLYGCLSILTLSRSLQYPNTMSSLTELSARQDGANAKVVEVNSMHDRDGLRTGRGYPLITVGIPTYNRAALVKSCVESVFAQTYPNIEVMVSDNASTDDTLAVLKSIKDERLRILTSVENVGAIENFSRCIREARGDYLVLLSDDNLWVVTTFLEQCACMIRAEPGLPIVLAAHDSLVLDEFHNNQRRIVPAVLSRKLPTGIWDGLEVLSEYCHGRISAGSLSVVVRTDILRDNNRYSDVYRGVHDTATWMPALLEGRAGLINTRCATYLIHGSSISTTIGPDDRLKDYERAMDELAGAASRKIPDSAKQRQVKGLAQRYLAYQAIITLVLYRRAGASLTDIVRKLWAWRTILTQCSLMDFVATARLRSVGRIVLPKPMVRLSMALGLDKLF
jgi:glycosyltransferase involved in cell wall biosynthesis